jgi:O-antigen/teichoic acid export membrane protein
VTPSVARSAGYGSAVFVATVLITFFQTPFILEALGTERYGTWALIGQITGYYGMLDLGTRGAISHFVSRSLAADKSAAVNQYVSSGAAILLAAGLTVLLTGAALVTLFPAVFELNGVPVVEVQSALIVTVCVVAFSLPFDVAAAVIVGARRPEIGSVLDTALRLLGFGAILVVLREGGGLFAMALIQLSTRAIGWVYLAVQAKRLVPGLRLTRDSVNRAQMRELFRYGNKSVVVNVSSLVINRIDVLLIGAVLGVRLVPAYVLAQSLIQYISGFVSVITRPFTTHFSFHHEKGETAEVARLYLAGAKVASVAGCVLAALAASYATPFLSLWVGAQFTTGVFGERADVVMIVLLIGQLPRMLQSITWQLLFGLRAPEVLARILLVEAAANLVLSLILVHYLGLLGVALGSVLPMLVTNLYRLPRVASAMTGLSWPEYIRRGPGAGVVLAAVALAIGLASRRIVPMDSWTPLLAAGAVTASATALIGWLFILSPAEQEYLLARTPFRARRSN